MTEKLIVRDALVVNATGRVAEPVDIQVDGGMISAIGDKLNPKGRTEIEAGGAPVIPGLVDPHVHVSGRFGGVEGFRMMVRGGVTACLDMAGEPTSLLANLQAGGCGVTAGVIYPLIPGVTVKGPNPGRDEIENCLERELAAGAFGLKLLGGHYPMTPQASALAIEICAERGVHCGVHVGTTATGSDIGGLEELVELAGGRRVQAAHINSYCRGQIADPVEEAARALSALRRMPAAESESYLATINGAEADCAGGVPVSNVVKTCLRLGGYPSTETGLIAAIRSGWAAIHVSREGAIVLADPEDGLDAFRAANTNIGVSFPVNPPASSLGIALARNLDIRQFTVKAFSSDGGSLPRNTTLRSAMGLVRARLLTLEDLVLKASSEGARILGLTSKGRIEVGADADLVVVGEDGDAQTTVCGGVIAYDQGRFPNVPGGRMYTLEEGRDAVRRSGVGLVEVAPIA